MGENAVTQSSDAFGQQVGSESTGLYDARRIRGFNPVDAGNVRIDGLYFDQVGSLSSRLLDSTRVRVGFGAIGFAFPAPGGLVDYALNVPNGSTLITLDGHLDVKGEYGGYFEFSTPVSGDHLGIFAGAGGVRKRSSDGRLSRWMNFGATIRWRPRWGGQITGLVGAQRQRDQEAEPIIYTAGAFLPPRIERGRNLSQPWADAASGSTTIGLIAGAPVGKLRLRAGLFHEQKHDKTDFADLLTGVDRSGRVDERAIVADGNGLDQSVSGELRLTGQFGGGAISHRLSLSLRGRDRKRRFGGAESLSLGKSTILAPDIRPEPDFVLGQKNTDHVSQLFYSLVYSGIVGQRLHLDIGISKTNYRKRVDFADPGVSDLSSSNAPFLWNVVLAYDLLPDLTVMGGVMRGMEEAKIAPDRAANRSESPPAIRTRQEEIGIRYTAGEGLTAVLATFRISKPYYNLDPSLRYRLLGEVANKGVELSLIGKLRPGLTLLGGAVFSDPRITGEAAAAGLIGPRPVGQAKHRMVANVDWRLNGGKSSLSFDLALESKSREAADRMNSFYTSASTMVDIGFRYRFSIADANMLLRGRLENVFNDYRWNVSPSGGFTYSPPRMFTLRLVADY